MEVLSIYLNRLIAESSSRNASALFLSAGSKPAAKFDGQMEILENEEMLAGDKLARLLSEILNPEERTELEEKKELTVVKMIGNKFRCRINIYYERGTPAFSFYYINPAVSHFSDFDFPPGVSRIVNQNHGLFIVAGPFGSGKTSIASALVEEINKTRKKMIITIDDPLEYVFANKKSIINQRVIGEDAPDVVSALDYCLREDVDVVYVNKISADFDMAVDKILELASGNTLVIFETSDDGALNVIQRIINRKNSASAPEMIRYNLADVLLAIVVQRMVPKIGGGTVPVREILIANSAVKTLIREGKIYQLESVIQTSRQEGMISMEKSFEELQKSGILPENISFFDN